jgi:hypothetical protein
MGKSAWGDFDLFEEYNDMVTERAAIEGRPWDEHDDPTWYERRGIPAPEPSRVNKVNTPVIPGKEVGHSMGKGKGMFARAQKSYAAAKNNGDTHMEGVARREMGRMARKAQRFNERGKDVVDEHGDTIYAAQPGRAAAQLRKKADYLDKKAVDMGRPTSKNFKV